MAEKINELIRNYQAGKITRREFMRRAILLTGSLAAANALLTHFYRSTASAQVAASDPAVSGMKSNSPERRDRFSVISLGPRRRGNFPLWF
jgi:hypothetical protein